MALELSASLSTLSSYLSNFLAFRALKTLGKLLLLKRATFFLS